MTNQNMTIRFTPDGFSFAECPDKVPAILDEAPLHDIAPGADFQHRLHEQVLDCIPPESIEGAIRCQLLSARVVLLPPEVTDIETATAMYRLTLTESKDEEHVLLQPLTLNDGQDVMLCYGMDHSLYHFMLRSYDDVDFEHHLAVTLKQAAHMASGNCLVVWCDSQMIELALFRQGKLDMVNVYNATQTENRAYYVMNTWQQMELDQLQDNLLVLSSGTEGLQVRASLHRFIKHVYG